jgi:hypothetical protein
MKAKKTTSKKVSPKKKKEVTIFGLRFPIKGATHNGVLFGVVMLSAIGLYAAMATGGILPSINKLKTGPTPGPQYTCCDTGDGAACQPILEKQITFNGQAYALLKSRISQGETAHIRPAEVSGTSAYTPDGHRIFLNSSDHTANYSNIEGCEPGKDLIGVDKKINNGKACAGIPNDEIIYVCMDTTENCAQNVKAHATPFDVYYRISDGPVPSSISTLCPKPKGSVDITPQQIIGVPTPGGRKNLQLETFQIKQNQPVYDYQGAWCKPAINLYPTQKTNIHVTVEPKGKFTFTLPQYPQDGWSVTAYPNGDIHYQNQTFPYLYYEAAIPNDLIPEPQKGYIVSASELPGLFNTILPKLGLNAREQTEFSDYWEKALPKSPYYFVGIIPQENLNGMAPLTISPAPDTLFRLSLYFKPLENNDRQVSPPQLNKFIRQGFAVVEWGGIVKSDKDHPFTCLM